MALVFSAVLLDDIKETRKQSQMGRETKGQGEMKLDKRQPGETISPGWIKGLVQSDQVYDICGRNKQQIMKVTLR